MSSRFSSLIFSVLLFNLIFILSGESSTARAQQIYQPNLFTGNPSPQPGNNYLANSTAFRQEIARMEINVTREGQAPLPITQVPRLAKDDVLRVRMLDEQVNGMKPDQTNWDWTFLVAFINPARNNEKERIVSEEIQFRKSGWYREYSFVVPYDSQPIFFIYTKPKYRDKILSLINKNQEEIRKIGEKTIELSGAYAKIGSFLNELQFVVNRYQYYGAYGNNYGYGTYGNYGTYGAYNNYGTYTGLPLTSGGFNQGMFIEQAIERLASSFNIQLPGCWQNNAYGNNGYYNGNNGVYNNGVYNNGVYNNYPYYGNGIYPNYGANNYGLSNDFLGRAQCVAKSVRLEDFDLSVSRMLQQGGILAAAQLSQKYPQLAFWINVAAAALDFILKLTRKAPLKLVPTVVSTTENPSGAYGYQQNPVIPQSYNYAANNFAPGTSLPGGIGGAPAAPVKISLFAESPPSENSFVTAYPLVIHKWQATPDPEVIGLPTPALMEPCLHAGQNILRSTDLLNDWMSDAFTKDFKLVISSPNGFRREFPLKKNVGLGGWELNITKEELNAFPKIKMSLESMITGKRGFNEIRSPQFELPVPTGGSWEVAPESQKEFAAGDRRTLTLRNQSGNCRCLQTVIYKPSFGGQFVFEAGGRENGLMFSPNGTEVSFTVDARNFLAGPGQLELRQSGGEVTILNVNLYPPPPNVTSVKIAKGDNQAIITGEGLEQIRAVKINGKRAIPADGNSSPNAAANNPQQPAPSYPTYQGYANNNQSAAAPNAYSYPSPGSGNQINNAPPVINNQAVSPISNPVNNYPPAAASGNYHPGAVPPSNAGNGAGTTTTVQNNGASNNYPNMYSGNIPTVNNQINNQSASPPTVAYPAPSYATTPPVSVSVVSERVFVFADAGARQDSNSVLLELELENNRSYSLPRVFAVSVARPTIAANEAKEVEGVAVGGRINPQFDLTALPVFPIFTRQISAGVQNALTDYDFKAENIQIETRIENGQVSAGELPKADFEVLDWKNMQLTFMLNEQSQRLLGGRRLQFRIRDRVRGDSDWYTLRSTFVRMPEIKSVKCAAAAKADCEIKGAGIEYISQVSIDGGKSWFPQEPATLNVKSTPDGQKAAQIPRFADKKLLRIRLRDFRTNEGLAINDSALLNTQTR